MQDGRVVFKVTGRAQAKFFPKFVHNQHQFLATFFLFFSGPVLVVLSIGVLAKFWELDKRIVLVFKIGNLVE